jgi:hypothetical protein
MKAADSVMKAADDVMKVRRCLPRRTLMRERSPIRSCCYPQLVAVLTADHGHDEFASRV